MTDQTNPNPEEQVQDNAPEKMTPEKFGEAALKFASETAYAAAGFANVVAVKAREFYEQQRAASAAKADEDGNQESGHKDFMDQLNEQLNKFVEDVQNTYKDLADRGRAAVSNMTTNPAKADEAKDDKPGPFDINDAADVADAPATDDKDSAE